MAAVDVSSRCSAAITEVLRELCSAPLVVPPTTAAAELVARHEYAAAVMRQSVEHLLERLAGYEAAGRDARH